MGVSWVVASVITVFWGIVGIPLPLILGRGPNKGVIQVVLVITAVTGWLFWVLTYMHQMNPLIGPQLHAPTVLALKYLWDHSIDIDDLPTPSPTTTEPFDNITSTLPFDPTTDPYETTVIPDDTTTTPAATTTTHEVTTTTAEVTTNIPNVPPLKFEDITTNPPTTSNPLEIATDPFDSATVDFDITTTDINPTGDPVSI